MLKVEELDKIKELIVTILHAINDWPIEINDLQGFIIELNLFVNDKVDFFTLESKLKEIDFSKEAWQAESITSLMKLYEYFPKTQDIAEIFEVISDIQYKRLLKID